MRLSDRQPGRPALAGWARHPRTGGAALRIDIVTIFPEFFAALRVSLIGKAIARGDVAIAVHDLRAWAHDPHRTVDDAPFGGGPGMVMKPEPWGEALDALAGPPAGLVAGAPARPGQPGAGGSRAGRGPGPVPGSGAVRGSGAEPAAAPVLIVPTPSGVPFTQAMAAELAGGAHLIVACGRYEGIDSRVTEYARARMTVREVSIGDYVLTGGEPAALVIVDAICRLLPGVLGNACSAADDSFGAGGGPMSGLVEGPVYTRPRVWHGMAVPAVLLSGDHGAIARWRRDQALRRTARNRPDLAARLPASALDARDREVLAAAGFAAGGEDVAH